MDTNNDGRVSLAELEQFVNRANEKMGEKCSFTSMDEVLALSVISSANTFQLMDLIKKLETETASKEQLSLGDEIVATPEGTDTAEEIKVSVISRTFYNVKNYVFIIDNRMTLQSLNRPVKTYLTKVIRRKKVRESDFQTTFCVPPPTSI